MIRAAQVLVAKRVNAVVLNVVCDVVATVAGNPDGADADT